MCREETLDELSSGLDEDDDEESEEALTARNVFEGTHNETTIHSSIPNDDKDEKVGYEENIAKGTTDPGVDCFDQ